MVWIALLWYLPFHCNVIHSLHCNTRNVEFAHICTFIADSTNASMTGVMWLILGQGQDVKYKVLINHCVYLINNPIRLIYWIIKWMAHPVRHNYLAYQWLLYISHPINVHSNHLATENNISILWRGSSCCSAHSKTNWILLAPMQPFTRSAVVGGAAVWVTCVPQCYQPSYLDEFLIAGEGLAIIRLRLAQLSSSVSQYIPLPPCIQLWFTIYIGLVDSPLLSVVRQQGWITVSHTCQSLVPLLCHVTDCICSTNQTECFHFTWQLIIVRCVQPLWRKDGVWRLGILCCYSLPYGCAEFRRHLNAHLWQVTQLGRFVFVFTEQSTHVKIAE